MCGIFGNITPGIPVDLARSEAALNTLAHRGPDGFGYLLASTRGGETRPAAMLNIPLASAIPGPSAPDVVLGHRRLAIIDLAERAGQPLSNEDGSCWIVFNGEIYNHRLLRRELEAKGHRFATDHADTEVLVHGYEQWGEDLLLRLDGMFAFAILDLRRKRVLLARDPFGEKPLYFAVTNRSLVFASEAKAVVHAMSERPGVSWSAIGDYLRFGYIPAPNSAFTGIQKLAAGTKLVAELGTEVISSIARYEPDSARLALTSHDFEDGLRASVLSRLESDVPVGVFLSGGVDSSSILRVTSNLPRDWPLRTFTIAFDHAAADESKTAAIIARRYGSAHHTELVASQTLLQLVPQVARVFDEPFADSSAVPTLALSRVTRGQVKVALSGDGGDELLGGYTRYRANIRAGRALTNPLLRNAAPALRSLARFWPEHVRGKGLLKFIDADDCSRYAGTIADEWLLAQSNLREIAPATDVQSVWRQVPGGSPLEKMMGVDRVLGLPDDLLTKVDRTSMSCGLEVRAPFLHTCLFANHTTAGYREDEPKAILRDSLRRDLGDGIASLPKRGFQLPVGHWLRTSLRSVAGDVFGVSSGIIKEAFGDLPTRLLGDHIRGSRDQSHRIWALMMLGLWEKEHLKLG